MSKNITYLLGAGASYNSVPLVLEIPFHLEVYEEYVRENFTHLNISEYLVDIEDLRSNLSEYNTIDGYARSLSQKETSASIEQLRKLKSITSGLLLFEQMKKKKGIIHPFDHLEGHQSPGWSVANRKRIMTTVDPRYKSFLGKVVHERKLDPRIRILSWNYDIQLEIALENNLASSYNYLGSVCKIFPHPQCDLNDSSAGRFSDYQIVKLNGTAGLFYKQGGFSSFYGQLDEYFDDRFEVLLDLHNKRTTEAGKLHMHFAWDGGAISKNAIEYAKNIVNQSQILVVIGYSFPDFNRSVDSKVFESHSLEKIYIQAPESAFGEIRENMTASIFFDDEVILRPGLNEFYIPTSFIPRY